MIPTNNQFDPRDPDIDLDDLDDLSMSGPGHHCPPPPFPGPFHGPPGFGGPFGPGHGHGDEPCDRPGAWFGPPGPPPPHGPHHHGPPGQGPPPGPPPLWPFGPQGPPPLLSKEAFQEIKHLFLLMIIQDSSPDGLTGYQLQEKYSIARGNLIRALEELETKDYLATRETVENGRNQKYYTITDKGKAYVEQLKEDWANRFAMLSEIAPPDINGNPFLRDGPNRRMVKDIEHFTSKEDAIDYFHGIRSMLKGFLSRAQERATRIEHTKEKLDAIIEKIEQMEPFDIEVVKTIVREAKPDIDDKNE